MNNKLTSHRDYRDVKIIQKKTLYQGFFLIDRYKLKFYRYDGTWTKPFDRELFQRGDSAAVLFFDPILDKVVLVEQFRMGAVREIAAKGSPWLIEIVAGVIEENESPETVIQREAKEEAGIAIQAKDLIKICDYYVSPGGSSEMVSLFCAKISTHNVEGIFGLAHEQEDIKVFAMNFNKALEYMSIGKINNASSIIALQWLQINQNVLKKH